MVKVRVRVSALGLGLLQVGLRLGVRGLQTGVHVPQDTGQLSRINTS